MARRSVGLSRYLSGGAGLYASGCDVTGLAKATSTDFGWNAGAGVALPLTVFKAVVEARYNSVSVNGGGKMEFVPITFGIMF